MHIPALTGIDMDQAQRFSYMTNAFFFGYGSLVNRQTHVYTDAHRVQVSGWRRCWRHTALRPIAFLTATPCKESTIDGLIAGVPNNDWNALDEREYAYDRVLLTDKVNHSLPRQPDIAIYTIPANKHGAPDRSHPILLSYLDVVVQGYLQEFGEGGAQAFFASTDGWDAPILDDRMDPIYPRHQSLTSSERSLVDALLENAGGKRFTQTASERQQFLTKLRG